MAEFETEKRAKNNWCPRVRLMMFVDAKGQAWVLTNRGDLFESYGAEIGTVTSCLGSRCAAWVEGPDVEMIGSSEEKTDSLSGRIKLVPTGRCGLKR